MKSYENANTVENKRICQVNELSQRFLQENGEKETVSVNLEIDLEREVFRIQIDGQSNIMEKLSFAGAHTENKVRRVRAYLNLIDEAMRIGRDTLKHKDQLK